MPIRQLFRKAVLYELPICPYEVFLSLTRELSSTNSFSRRFIIVLVYLIVRIDTVPRTSSCDIKRVGQIVCRKKTIISYAIARGSKLVYFVVSKLHTFYDTVVFGLVICWSVFTRGTVSRQFNSTHVSGTGSTLTAFLFDAHVFILSVVVYGLRRKQ